MMRLIQDTKDNRLVTNHEVTDVHVHAGGKIFTFIRGKNHTPADIANAAIRKALQGNNLTQLWVTDPMGNVLFPSPAKTREQALEVHDRFTRASSLFVYTRRSTNDGST
jgi:hypothetical protein